MREHGRDHDARHGGRLTTDRRRDPGEASAGAAYPGRLPSGTGIGLRAGHHDEFLARRPDVPWVEVHSENFFASGGRALRVLESVRRDYPLSLHGVGLSLGSADPLDTDHLRHLKDLVRRFEPCLVSEHVSWSSIDGIFLNDLLPLPLDAPTLSHMVSRVGQMQDFLGREVLLENVSSYLVPGASEMMATEMTEWEFLAALASQSGCRLLVDVNNIHVNAVNHGFDADDYLAGLPAAAVGEIHLAGHQVRDDAGRTLLVDTHDAPVAEPVWELYRSALRYFCDVPTLIERDARLPSLDTLIEEARRADRMARSDVRTG